MKLFRREQYLKKIHPFYDDDPIKVITGIRRCGKSCLIATIVDELKERGVEDKDIVYLDLDKRGNRSIKTPDQLDDAIEALLVDGDFKYLFIDKDIRSRNKIRNVNAFNRAMTYVINNYGAPTSHTNLHDHFTSIEHIAVERRTIAAYVQMLVDAKVLYKCERFDLKSRKSLRGEEKYYLADPGIYFARNVNVRLNYGPSLENALYIYLRSRGYKLSVGRIGKLACDFIARKRNAYAYMQVSMTIAERNVEEREYRPFGYIKDGYPRYLFTLDPLLQDREGVRHLNMITFMKNDSELRE